MTSRIEIYTKSVCPFCQRAKRLLHIKGVSYLEYDVGADPERAVELLHRSSRQTVPVIFIDDRPIGGCSDLFELDERGQLDRLLGFRP